MSNKVPATMEEAINNAKWCQHVHQTVYGKKTERTRVVNSDPDEPMVHGTYINALQSLRLRAGLGLPHPLA